MEERSERLSEVQRAGRTLSCLQKHFKNKKPPPCLIDEHVTRIPGTPQDLQFPPALLEILACRLISIKSYQAPVKKESSHFFRVGGTVSLWDYLEMLK